MNFELKDVVAFSIGAAGLLLSLFTLYRTQFRRPDIRVVMGPDFHFYYDTIGSPALYLPVIFQNHSPTTGFVIKALITVRDTGGRAFSVTWWDSFEIKWPEVEYLYQGRARPKKVAGYDSVADVFWGVCRAKLNGIPLEWRAGTYTITLRFWTKITRKPSGTASAKLIISKDAEDELLARRAAKETNSRYEYFEGRAVMAFADDDAPNFSTREF